MKRSKIVMFFLSFWIFTVLAPPLITVFNGAQETIVLIDANEEEKKETDKKSGKNNLFFQGASGVVNYGFLRYAASMEGYLSVYKGISLDVLLPPPERA